MKSTLRWTILILATAILSWGCGTQGTKNTSTGNERNDSGGKSDSSIDAVFLEFSFDAELLTNSSWNVNAQIEKQLLYTVGQLNGDNSISRMDQVELTNVKKETVEGGTKVTYHAKLIVAWGKKNSIPSTYTFKLPKDVSYSGQERFTTEYSHSCVDWGAHDVTSNSMWYYYRPARSGCKLADEHIITVKATVSTSDINTSGKYPEYHKVWEDGVFRTVAIFGKYEDGDTSNSDAGISAYNRFIRDMKNALSAYNLTTIPAELPSTPGVDTPDITFNATLPDGKKIEVVALLIDGVRSAGTTFDNRYGALSGKADLIAYNGHSGLGANIRELARKGKWEAKQYTVVYMNGCDTYAYVDSALYDARIKLNPEDTKGTKHLDMIMNAMPSYFRYMGDSTLALFKALMDHENPKTYEKIFKDFDRSQVVLVSGEEDNVYYPGYTGETEVPEEWTGLNESGDVEQDKNVYYETPVLEAGTYLFELSGTGDADLYVRLSKQPTVSLYDCRPYRWGSRETCKVEVSSPTAIHIMVRGYDPDSSFTVVGSKQ